MAKQLQIRNSTAEFLIFQAEDKAQGVQVYYQDEMIWATQEAIATLFDKGRSTITEHLKNIFETGELDQNSVCRKFRRTAADGKNYETQFYNLDAIISVGYRKTRPLILFLYYFPPQNLIILEIFVGFLRFCLRISKKNTTFAGENLWITTEKAL